MDGPALLLGLNQRFDRSTLTADWLNPMPPSNPIETLPKCIMRRRPGNDRRFTGDVLCWVGILHASLPAEARGALNSTDTNQTRKHVHLV